jgi:Tol biopolymer transport system component
VIIEKHSKTLKQVMLLKINIISAFLLLPLLAWAQPFDRSATFGTNRIQHKNFKWRFIATENFEIYYYGESYSIAVTTAEYAEQELSRIVALVGNAPYTKTKIFVYQSINDLRQSNVGIKHQGVSMGGQTRFYRSQVEVAFTGNKHEFKKELIRSIADLFLFEMVYGGSFKNILRSSFLLSIPEWFLSGAARYIGYGWSQEMDDYMRDVFFNRNTQRLSRLEGEEAEIAGQSVWNYVVIKYGASNMANILSLTKLFRDEKTSIQNTLNLPYNKFLVSWKNFYLENADKLMEDLYIPTKNEKVKKLKKSAIFNKLEFSPNGSQLAYTQSVSGRWKVKVFDMQKRTTKTVLSGGYKVLNQRTNPKIPLFSWQDDEHLVILSTRSWKNYLWIYDLNKIMFPKKRIKFRSFNNINDFDISEDGKKMVLSAELKGSSDIYIYNIKPRTYQIITSDEYDDITPRFMPDGKSVLFASNRKSDTLVVNSGELPEINEHFNLFQYEFGKTTKLKRLTSTVSYDHSPKPIGSDEVLYLSNQRGITQIFKVNIQTGYHTQLTSVYQSLKNFDFDGQRLVYNINYKGKDQFFLIDTFLTHKSAFSAKTNRQEFMDKKFVEEMRRKAKEKEKEKIVVLDSVPKKEEVKASLPIANHEEIDTDNYIFEGSTDTKASERLSDRIKRLGKSERPVLTKKDEATIKETSQYYRQEFTVDNFAINPFRDILRGFGMKADVALTDELENHKINVGIFGGINLANNSFFFEYEYLKHRLDINLRYERLNFLLDRENPNVMNQKYQYNTMEMAFIYPFSVASRLSITPFAATTRFLNLELTNLAQPTIYRYFAGVKAEFVFDNTITLGYNIRSGSSFKVRYENFTDAEHFQDNKKANQSFSLAMVELRRYQKIHRNISIVFRGSYGTMFGAKPRSFSLGGIPNNVILSADLDRKGPEDPFYYDPNAPGAASVDRTDWMLHRFVGPLRGFNNNKLFGQNYLLGNVELRFPIIKYFYRGNINNNFFRNLQIIGFYDIGTSWTGAGPFTEENSINTETISAPPFNIKVINFRQPFLVGYGTGLRSTILGFNTKIDVAWGQQDNLILENSPRVYLSLGLDF